MQGLLAEVVPPDHPTSAPTIAPTGLSGPPVFPNLVNPPIMAHYDPPVSTQLPPMSSHSPFFHSGTSCLPSPFFHYRSAYYAVVTACHSY